MWAADEDARNEKERKLEQILQTVSGVFGTRVKNSEQITQCGEFMTVREILQKLNYNLACTTVTEWVQVISSHPTPLTGGEADGVEAGAQQL